MRRDKLTLSAFQESPAWAFDDDQLTFVPIDLDAGLPEESVPLFVQAELTTSCGRQLPGYVVVSASVYALGVLDGDHEFVFNSRLPDLLPTLEAEVRKRFGIPAAEAIFPIRYHCKYAFPLEDLISGNFPRPS